MLAWKSKHLRELRFVSFLMCNNLENSTTYTYIIYIYLSTTELRFYYTNIRTAHFLCFFRMCRTFADNKSSFDENLLFFLFMKTNSVNSSGTFMELFSCRHWNTSSKYLKYIVWISTFGRELEDLLLKSFLVRYFQSFRKLSV